MHSSTWSNFLIKEKQLINLDIYWLKASNLSKVGREIAQINHKTSQNRRSSRHGASAAGIFLLLEPKLNVASRWICMFPARSLETTPMNTWRILRSFQALVSRLVGLPLWRYTPFQEPGNIIQDTLIISKTAGTFSFWVQTLFCKEK